MKTIHGLVLPVIDIIGPKNSIGSDELTKIINKDNFENYVLKEIPDEWEAHDVILGEKMFVDNWKFSKILKHAKGKFLKVPNYF